MIKKILTPLIAFFILLSLWEFSARYFHDLLFILPSPSDILITLWKSFDRLSFHSLLTLQEMLGGFFLALCAAFPLAWIMLYFKNSRTIIQPLFIIIQCLPMFTLAPLMVIWFGWSYISIVVPTALMIFFPLTLNIYQGLRSTPIDLLEFFQTNQATALQTFFKLQLPWALPHIFAGLRISSAIAGIGAIAGEWAGAQNGLGILMLESRRTTDLEITFGALFCLTAMSACFYGGVIALEKILHPSKIIRKTNRSPIVILAIVISSLAFFACQNKKNSSASLSKASSLVQKRLLLDWLPNPNHVPIYLGLEKKFFEEEGIELIVQKMHESGHGISYLTSGQADLLINHMPGTLRAMARGAKIEIVGSLIKEPLNAILYLKNLNIKKPEELSNLPLGYCVGGPDTAFLDAMLSEKGVCIKQKYNVGVDLVSCLCTQKVDAIFGAFWNIEPSQLQSLNVEVEYFKPSTFNVPNYYEMIILAKSNTEESSTDFVEKFQKALQKSISFCQQYPDIAFAIYLKHNPDKREKTIQWERKAWEATYPILAKDQSIDLEGIHKFYIWMKKHHLFSQSKEAESLVLQFQIKDKKMFEKIL